jgi:hypothetical protein
MQTTVFDHEKLRACLDVLAARKNIEVGEAGVGNEILLGVVLLVAGLIAKFSDGVGEEQTQYLATVRENEND